MPYSPTELLNINSKHDQRLLTQTHPRDWINPEPPAKGYDLVVIGAGVAGLVSAAGAAGLGARVALIERHLMGGDCLNTGCVPSKSLIAAAHVAGQLRHADTLGWQIPAGAQANFAAVMERLRKIRADISPEDSVTRFDELGIDVFLGHGEFSSNNSITVAHQHLIFKRAIIATGGRARLPDIPGLTAAKPLTNETVFNLTERPAKLAIIGGGPIGCELAQSFARLGSQVTLLETGSRILSKEDADISQMVQKALAEDGVTFELNAQISRVDQTPAATLITLRTGEQGAYRQISVDKILVAAGRQANIDSLNLKAAAVKHSDNDGIMVNEQLRTSNRRIYAVGDVCMAWQFTHAADAAARMVLQNAFFFGRKKLSTLTMPWATYTDPEIAHVGLNETMAAQRNLAIDTYVEPLINVHRAQADGRTEGLLKIHTKQGSGKIIGATFVGPHAGDMLNIITLAMQQNISLGTLANVIHPYPTYAEAIKHVADAYNRTRLTSGIKRLFAWWFRWLVR